MNFDLNRYNFAGSNIYVKQTTEGAEDLLIDKNNEFLKKAFTPENFVQRNDNISTKVCEEEEEKQLKIVVESKTEESARTEEQTASTISFTMGKPFIDKNENQNNEFVQVIPDEQKQKDPIKPKPKENKHFTVENPNTMSMECQSEPLKLEPIQYLKYEAVVGGSYNTKKEERKSKNNQEELSFRENLLQNKIIEDQLIKVTKFHLQLSNISVCLCRILRI